MCGGFRIQGEFASPGMLDDFFWSSILGLGFSKINISVKASRG